MAATDTKRTGLQNQKRGVCVAVSELLASAADSTAVPVEVAVVSDGSTICTLPDKSLVVRITLIVTAASAASDTIDINYAGSEIGSEIACDVLGAIVDVPTSANAYSATGGDIVVKNGSQPVDTTFRGRVVIEYVELDKVTGEYTA